MREDIDRDARVPSSRIPRCGRLDLHPAEIPGLSSDLCEPLDQGLDRGITRPHGNMDGHRGSFLGTDAIRRDGAIRTGEEHAASDQDEGGHEDKEPEFDHRIQLSLGLWHREVRAGEDLPEVCFEAEYRSDGCGLSAIRLHRVPTHYRRRFR